MDCFLAGPDLSRSEVVEFEAAWAGSVECRPEKKAAWRPLVRVGLLEFSWILVLLVFYDSEAFDGCGYGNSAIFDFNFKSVALFAVDVEIVKFVRNFDGKNFFSSRGLDPYADDLTV